MNLIVHFKDGRNVTMENWDKWETDMADNNDVVQLFVHYKEINKELSFRNPKTGFEEKRFAEEVKSIEIVFE